MTSTSHTWAIPTWAEQTVFNHEDGVATHYSSETGAAYLQRVDEIRPDTGEQVTGTEALVIAIDGQAIFFDPANVTPDVLNRLILDLTEGYETWAGIIA